MTDHLAKRIKQGDEMAFELLFRTYYTRMCAFSNKFLNDPEQAREIVQDVFTKIWEGRDRINPAESLKSYLFKITQNLSLNRLQHRRVESRYAEIYSQVYFENTEISPYESLLGSELEDRIVEAIQDLPTECRAVFELSRKDGLKYNEIAERQGISVKTVEAQISKALRTMRLKLKDYLVLF